MWKSLATPLEYRRVENNYEYKLSINGIGHFELEQNNHTYYFEGILNICFNSELAESQIIVSECNLDIEKLELIDHVSNNDTKTNWTINNDGIKAKKEKRQPIGVFCALPKENVTIEDFEEFIKQNELNVLEIFEYESSNNKYIFVITKLFPTDDFNSFLIKFYRTDFWINFSRRIYGLRVVDKNDSDEKIKLYVRNHVKEFVNTINGR